MDKNKSNRTTFTQKDQCLVRKMSKIKKVHDKHIETEEEYEIEHDKAILQHYSEATDLGVFGFIEDIHSKITFLNIYNMSDKNEK